MKSLVHYMGLPALFVTVAPCDFNQLGVLQLTMLSQGQHPTQLSIPLFSENKALRIRNANENPGFCADIYQRLLEVVVEELYGLCAHTKRKRMLPHGQGIFGTMRAHYACSEPQGRGTLHWHQLRISVAISVALGLPSPRSVTHVNVHKERRGSQLRLYALLTGTRLLRECNDAPLHQVGYKNWVAMESRVQHLEGNCARLKRSNAPKEVVQEAQKRLREERQSTRKQARHSIWTKLVSAFERRDSKLAFRMIGATSRATDAIVCHVCQPPSYYELLAS